MYSGGQALGGGSLAGAPHFRQLFTPLVEIHTRTGETEAQDQAIDFNSGSETQDSTQGNLTSNSYAQNQFDCVDLGNGFILVEDLDVSKYCDMFSPDYYRPPSQEEL